MSQFEDREQAFEKKFEMDEEIKFKAAARAAKMLGFWAAERMGLTQADAEKYVKDVLEADLRRARQADVVNKIEADFRARKIDVPRLAIARELESLMEKAREQLKQS